MSKGWRPPETYGISVQGLLGTTTSLRGGEKVGRDVACDLACETSSWTVDSQGDAWRGGVGGSGEETVDQDHRGRGNGRTFEVRLSAGWWKKSRVGVLIFVDDGQVR